MSLITYPGLVMTSVDVTYPDKKRNPKLVEFNGDDTNPKDKDTTALILRNLTGRKQGPFWNRKLIFSGEVVAPEEIVRGAKKPLIVIHGFNTSTEAHIRNCKEATEKFKNFNVIPVVWPSAGGITNYWNDRKYSIAAGKALNSLKDFAGLFPHKSLMAHSMGNRVLREFANDDYTFDNIFMIAADVERRIFDKDYIDNNSKERHQDAFRIKDMLSKDNKDSKIYVLHNSTDYALTGSTIVKLGRSRLGARGADFETMHPEFKGKVENINCGTWLNGLNFASHSYHFADEALKIMDSKFIAEDGDSTEENNNANSDNIETFEDNTMPV